MKDAKGNEMLQVFRTNPELGTYFIVAKTKNEALNMLVEHTIVAWYAYEIRSIEGVYATGKARVL